MGPRWIASDVTTLAWTDPRHPWMRDYLVLETPPEPHTGWCAWCGRDTSRGEFCSADCRLEAAKDSKPRRRIHRRKP